MELSMSSRKSPAMQRYVKRLAGLMVIYVALIFGVGFLFRLAPPSGALAYAAAVLPALPILGVFWAIFRLLAEETDEYIRHILVRQVLFATGFCLSVMTVWEFLQGYEVLPLGTGGFGTAFVWFVGLGIGTIINALAARAEAGEE
jgi:uncharacterized membrane protein